MYCSLYVMYYNSNIIVFSNISSGKLYRNGRIMVNSVKLQHSCKI